jgi:hypothetical protein
VRTPRLALPALSERVDRVSEPELSGPELIHRLGECGMGGGKLVHTLGRHAEKFGRLRS